MDLDCWRPLYTCTCFSDKIWLGLYGGKYRFHQKSRGSLIMNQTQLSAVALPMVRVLKIKWQFLSSLYQRLTNTMNNRKSNQRWLWNSAIKPWTREIPYLQNSSNVEYTWNSVASKFFTWDNLKNQNIWNSVSEEFCTRGNLNFWKILQIFQLNLCFRIDNEE